MRRGHPCRHNRRWHADTLNVLHPFLRGDHDFFELRIVGDGWTRVTLLDAGHANNALPQRATANVNCRIFPGETVEGTQAALVAAMGDPGVKVTPVPPVRPVAVPPPLDPKIMNEAGRLVAKYYPGVPLVPSMSTGATDGIFLEAIGIPVYGAPGGWGDPDGNGVHGLTSAAPSVQSLWEETSSPT
jgi:acetylornithine deacetylase/succinyl-diaminopimelate desuccinylase-like protein